MSLSGISTPLASNLYTSGLTGASSAPTTATANPLLGQQSGGSNSQLGAAPLAGNMSGALTQILSMVMMLLQALLPQLMGGGTQQPGTADTTQTLAAHHPSGGSSSNGGSPTPSNPDPAAPPPDQQPSSQNQPPDSQSNPPPTGSSSSPTVGNGAGWNKNVNVFTSSAANHETTDMYSGGKLVGGYLSDLEKGMDSGKTLTQANTDAQSKNTEGAISNNASPNSLVKGKGGNAIVVTGDNYNNEGDADQYADKLRKDYGMNVQVIHDASPNQLKAAMQKMGGQKGQQCMVAVMAHGAQDNSGQNNGMIALGKGDGDQWLSESNLKSMVNQYLAPNYGNVNVVLNSCYSGNFVS